MDMIAIHQQDKRKVFQEGDTIGMHLLSLKFPDM
jgi:hypothetical protein